MTVNIDKAISHFKSLQAKGVTYSMYGSRTGVKGSADCSGAVYAALVAGGATTMSYVPSTETMHAWLIKNGFKLIAENKSWNAQKGDVTIWGKIGFSGGAGGHTGIWVDSNNWIECTAWKNGIIIDNHDRRWNDNGQPYFYTYRLQTTSEPTKPTTSTNPDKIKWIAENGTFISNQVIHLRSNPSTSASYIAKNIAKGSQIKYDAYAFYNGYVWIRQPRQNGKYGYMATGEEKNGKRLNYWGTFK